MLIVPFYKKIDWKNPPLITLFLVITNCLVFLFIQNNDDDHYESAVQYYVDSELPQLEFPLYLQHLENTLQLKLLNKFRPAVSQENKRAYPYIYISMDQDPEFAQKIFKNTLFTEDHPNYAQWVSLRHQLNIRLQKVVWKNYGLVPSQPTATTLFSHMFLHGDFGHLLGNMLFLFVLGFVVESILGKGTFLGLYMLAGLASGTLDVLVNPNSLTVSIGASGAIAGIMGMYTVLFGLRKINFFYFAFVYFDYVKAPAIILLPLWLGFEIYNYAFSDTNVNYLAHIGGLVSGTVLAFIVKRYTDLTNEAYMDESEKTASFSQRFEEGMDQLGSMKYAKARQIFLTLHSEEPNNIQVLQQLYNISKHNPPENMEYQQYAQQIFLKCDPSHANLVLDTFRDYVKRSRKNVRIPPDTLLKLAKLFVKSDQLAEAEMIVASLLQQAIQQKKSLTGLAQTVLNLTYALHKKGQSQKCRRYLTALITHFSGQPEATEAKVLLERIN
ncbi:MAG: rhomboid family intramembrane serine protease [Gammaproteobacteria bacterium]|nr:rhomboid family intramembrane serine protease [Gammaproteobacteria bacterium]MDH5801809.1 rhomboid family intramembrane serine protease [Gammaproteobacteria bacterium]